MWTYLFRAPSHIFSRRQVVFFSKQRGKIWIIPYVQISCWIYKSLKCMGFKLLASRLSRTGLIQLDVLLVVHELNKKSS